MTTATKAKYELKTETLGLLEKQELKVVHMPRDRFLELVSDELDSGRYKNPDALRRELWPIAKKMPRFPLDTWLDTTRGCGCVVGEYLVATREIREHNRRVTALIRRKAVIKEGVEKLLADNPLGDDLFEFGGGIDTRIREELQDNVADPHGLAEENYEHFEVELVVIDKAAA